MSVTKQNYYCADGAARYRWAGASNIITVPKTSTLLGVGIENGNASVKFEFYVLLEFTFVKNRIASNKLHSPVGYEAMFEKQRKH